MGLDTFSIGSVGTGGGTQVTPPIEGDGGTKEKEGLS